MVYYWFLINNLKLAVQPKRTVSEEGPSPRTFVANTVINMLLKLEQVEAISNMWLHCPLVHAEAEIVTESHVLPEMESE